MFQATTYAARSESAVRHGYGVNAGKNQAEKRSFGARLLTLRLINLGRSRNVIASAVMLLFFAFLGNAAGYQPSSVAITGGASTCQYTPITLTATIGGVKCANGGGTFDASGTITWYSNVVNSTVGGTPVFSEPYTSNATANVIHTYDPDVSTVGTLYYYYIVTWNDNGQGGSCGPGSLTSGTQTVTVTPGPTQANAGPDQSPGDCSTSTTLAGNTILTGTGNWTVSPAGPAITTPGSPTSTVTGMTPGTAYTFTWTSTLGACTTSDQMVFNSIGPGCATYCTPTGFGSNADGHIDSVNINGTQVSANSGWGAGGYQDFSGSCVTVAQGEPFTMSVAIERLSSFDMYGRYWIDWNGDGDFTNDGSSAGFGFTTDVGMFSFGIDETVPCDAAVGNLKIRFAVQYNVSPGDPCTSANTWGEFEDYCINVVATPVTVATVSPDQVLAACDDDASISGTAPVGNETGSWSIVSGSGSFSPNAQTNAVTVSGLGPGANQFEWTITDEYGCNSTSDIITITTSGLPSQANAGPNQGSCATSFTMAAETPTAGVGTWVLVSAGSGSPTLASDPTTTINGVTVGTAETWEWQVTNPPCPQVSTDQVTLTSESGVTPPVVTPSGNACSGVLTVVGNTPTVGSGFWTCTGGDCGLMSMGDPTNPILTVTGFDVGESATFTWTISGAGCTPQSASTTQTAIFCTFDEPCEATTLTVSDGLCNYTTFDNTGMSASTAYGQPGCGYYAGSDVWFTATVPETGQLEINAVDAAGGSSMFMGIAIYDGADCNNLEHAGCDGYASMGPPSPSSTIMAEATYIGQPGTQVWIRAWSGNGNEGQFNICAWTHSNNYGDIFAGNTTITCGQDYQFLDPGGEGNYQDNSGANYVICPDSPGEYVSIDFTTGFFDVENGYDKLTILDGSTTSAEIIGQWSGTNSPGTVTSSAADGCLTVIWQTDISIQDIGWDATVSCTSTPGTNTPICSPTNCSGECGQWICADGLYPTNNDGNGIEDLAIHTSGCFTSAGEIASKWFYFTALTAGTIEFTFNGPNGQDYNLAVWGPSMDGVPPCPMSTGDAPIRCSQADVQNTSNPVGLGNGSTEHFEGPEGDGWLEPLSVSPGETYAMILNIYMNGNPQPEIDLTIGGTGTLDCSVLAATIASLEGVSLGDKNQITWISQTETNNDFFTVERSINGIDWEIVGTVDGAGNSQHPLYYSMIDENPYQPVTYYRLKQTDYDGAYTYFPPISVSRNKPTGAHLISQPFPNPANDYLTVTFDQKYVAKEMTVRLVDGFGRNVFKNIYTEVQPGMPMTINTRDIASGVYQLVVEVGEQQQTHKISIAH